jgi:hypothetical protein
MNGTKVEPFHFHTRQNLIYLTGRKAKNISELLNGIRELPLSSIYFHTHHYLVQFEFLIPEPPNDFAYWIKNIFQDRLLGEEVESIDLRQFSKLEEIRNRLIYLIESAITREPDIKYRNSPPGEEFYFKTARTFVFPTKYIAYDLQQFLECLKNVTIYSIYFHVFEARLRGNISDFSNWLLHSLNEVELAREFNRLDPYSQTLDSLRKLLIRIIEKKIKGNPNA